MNRINKMRTKNFLIVLSCIITTSMVLILMGPTSNIPSAHDSTIRSIFSQTNQQFQHFKDSLPVGTEPKNQLLVDDKYLILLGYLTEEKRGRGASSSKNPTLVNRAVAEAAARAPPREKNGQVKADSLVTEELVKASSWKQFPPQTTGKAEKLTNFSVVSYVVASELAAAVQLVKNLNAAVPSEHLLMYDLGLNEDDQRTLQKYCYPIINSSLSASGGGHYSHPSQRHHSTAGQARVGLNYAEAGVNEGTKIYNSYSVVPNSSNGGLNEDFLGNGGSSPYKCWLIKFDAGTTGFPAYVIDDVQIHAFRPLIVRDALHRWAQTVLFLQNSVRLRTGVANELAELRHSVEASLSGVKGWCTEPTLAVSARTHQKMYEYFHTDDDNFKFLKMISLDAMFFVDRPAVNQRILLPWIKCALTPECIHPIGAQSNGCKLNKKPQYRYSGCHDYDASALNIVLGLTFSFDDQKYALDYDREALFYTESLNEATKILEQKRKNISETSDHPYTDD